MEIMRDVRDLPKFVVGAGMRSLAQRCSRKREGIWEAGREFCAPAAFPGWDLCRLLWRYYSKNTGRIEVYYPNLLLSAPREPCAAGRLILGKKIGDPEGSWLFPSSASVFSCPMLGPGMGCPTEVSLLPLPSEQPHRKITNRRQNSPKFE